MNRKGDSRNTPSGKFPEIVMDDLRRGDLKRTFRRDLRDIYEFYLDEESRARLRREGRFKRWLLTLGWVAKSLFLNLSPNRRLLLLLALVFFLFGDLQLGAGTWTLDLDLTPPAFLVLLFILLLELKDKLLARDELETGRKVQMSLLPDDGPEVPGWDIRFHTRPANDVGGDLVDYLKTRDDRVALILGDVAGKGLGAALLMAKLQATLRAVAGDILSLGELGARMNAIFCRDQVPGRFATLVYLEIRPGTGTVRILNAGHLPPVLLRRTAITAMEPVSPPIGLLADAGYSEQDVALEPGEGMLVFSDGVTEARNAAGDFYGDDRLLRLLASVRDAPAGHVLGTILADLETFMGEERAADDVSLIFIRRLS